MSSPYDAYLRVERPSAITFGGVLATDDVSGDLVHLHHAPRSLVLYPDQIALASARCAWGRERI